MIVASCAFAYDGRSRVAGIVDLKTSQWTSQESYLMFHRHKWVEIERQFCQVQSLWSKDWGDITVLTFQCSCGKYKQDELSGTVTKKREEVPP